MRRKAIRGYLFDRTKQNKGFFWNSVKPFFSIKSGAGSEKIIISENSKIISEQSEIAEIMNDFFVNVAADIGKDHTLSDLQNHPSILEIKKHNQHITFDFSPTTSDDVFEILKNSKYKKATGPDGIPPIFLKYAGSEIAPIISGLINKSIEQGFSPSVLKKTSVLPIYKKADKLEKGNYRPISLLPILTKIFEKVLAHQISPFLNDVLSPHLSAFRRGYSCQDALLGLLEHWCKDCLAKKKIGALIIDLSKAFDCMPHELWCSAKISLLCFDTFLMQIYVE